MKTRTKLVSSLMFALVVFVAACGDDDCTIVTPGVTVIPGSLTLESQEDIDLMRGVREIRGHLHIFSMSTDDEIVDLTPLSDLERVDGELFIGNCRRLETLTGLESLRSVGGYCRFEGMDSLSSLYGLQNLESGGDALTLRRLPALVTLEGLRSLTTIHEYLVFSRLPSLLSLEGLESLVLTEQSVSFERNDSLRALEGPDWDSFTGSLEIRSNPALEGLDGLEDVTALRYLRLVDNTSLLSFRGLEKLTEVGWFEYAGSEEITDFPALPELIRCGGVAIGNMPNLTRLETLRGVEIEALSIWNTGISDMQDFSHLDALARISLGRNSALSHLTGLENIRLLHDLQIEECPSLGSLALLSGCEIDRSIHIRDCDLLEDLRGLEGTAESLSRFELTRNYLLSDISSPADLRRIQDALMIGYNPSLCDTTINAWAATLEVEGRIQIERNAVCR